MSLVEEYRNFYFKNRAAWRGRRNAVDEDSLRQQLAISKTLPGPLGAILYRRRLEVKAKTRSDSWSDEEINEMVASQYHITQRTANVPRASKTI